MHRRRVRALRGDVQQERPRAAQDIYSESRSYRRSGGNRAHDAQISTTLQQYLENTKSAPENAKRLVYELAENVITILWCLS
jgi:hypothetical protein